MNRALATIDLRAYRHNLIEVQRTVAPAAVMAVVKADAYGHGIVPVTLAAVGAGITSVGTLDIDSALLLRAAGVDRSIMIFTWLIGPADDLEHAVRERIDLGVSSLTELNRVAAAARSGGAAARVHLKIDTGLHRNGVDAADWSATVARALELQHAGEIALVGVWTHISEASYGDDTTAIHKFEAALSEAARQGAVLEVRHLAASAASFERPDARYDLVRIGAFSYGIAPGGGVGPAQLNLQPVMTLTAPVVHRVDERLVSVAIGYADGISSRNGGRVEVTIEGVRCALTAVLADHLLVESADAEAGDTVTLFGDPATGAVTLQEWADATGTIGEEIVTRLSSHIERRYLGQ